jgi:hypothetical protein
MGAQALAGITGTDARKQNWLDHATTTGQPTRSMRAGHAQPKITKYDLIAFIDTNRDRFDFTGAQGLHMLRYGDGAIELQGDPSDIIEDYMGRELSIDCIPSSINFRLAADTDPIVEMPDNFDRLWSTVVGLDSIPGRASFGAFHGVAAVDGKRDQKVTMLVQDLGGEITFADMWSASIRRFSEITRKAPVYAAVNERVRSENLVIKKSWVCRLPGEPKTVFSFTLIEGWWNISLETLADHIFEQAESAGSKEQCEREFTMAAMLGPLIDHVTKITLAYTTAGRDTMHYAWRFTNDHEGHEWLEVGLLPLPYYLHSLDPFKALNSDALVRRAIIKSD